MGLMFIGHESHISEIQSARFGVEGIFFTKWIIFNVYSRNALRSIKESFLKKDANEN